MAQAHAGFSPAPMLISMSASAVLLLWAVAVGVAVGEAHIVGGHVVLRFLANQWRNWFS